MTHGGSEKVDGSVEDYVRRVVDAGAGEILLQSIDRDGTKTGYDIELVEQIARLTTVPVVPLGGAAGVDDLGRAVAAGASAAAAGSMFVFTGKHDAVLISYPDEAKVAAALAAAASTTVSRRR
jgi:cyclase